MKTKILLIAVLHFIGLAYSQKADTITYDLKTKTYYSNEAKANIKKLANDTEYKIKVSNINPFFYKTTLKIKQEDKVKQVFELFKSVTSGSIPTFKMATESNSLVNSFASEYETAIMIDASLKTSYFDINKISMDNLGAFTEANTLLNSYYGLNEDERKKNPTELAEIKRLNSVMNELVYFIKYEHREITLGTFKTDGTDYELELTFTPPTGNVINAAEKKVTTSFQSTGRIKIYFSTGLLLANPVNSKYYVSLKNENNQYTILEEDRENYSLGAMALAHFMFSNESKTKFGFNAGGAIDLDAQLRFLLGGTVMYKKFAFNLGYNFAYKEVLSDKFELKKEYIEKPEIATKKVFKGGFWFGISYTIL